VICGETLAALERARAAAVDLAAAIAALAALGDIKLNAGSARWPGGADDKAGAKSSSSSCATAGARLRGCSRSRRPRRPRWPTPAGAQRLFAQASAVYAARKRELNGLDSTTSKRALALLRIRPCAGAGGRHRRPARRRVQDTNARQRELLDL
jgi:hypothetical protein